MRLSGGQFARLHVTITKKFYLPDRAIPHPYAMGESAGRDEQGRGRWWSFNFMDDDEFWRVIIDACFSGELALPWWYDAYPADEPPVEIPPPPPPPVITPQPPVSGDALTMLKALAQDVEVTTARWRVELATIQAKLQG